MKKVTKSFIAFSCVIALVATSTAIVFAETYFSDGNFTFTRNNNRLTICYNDKVMEDVVFPETIYGDTVVAIANAAYQHNSDIKTVTFPKTLESIGQFAFSNMTNLTVINPVPAGCTSIGNGAFQSNPNLSSISIEAPITEIPQQMLYNCPSLKTFDVPQTVTKINRFAFMNCTSLERVTLPKGITSIADDSFKNCPNLTVYGYKNTYAQTYCEQKNISFVAVDAYKLGDVDLNGMIDVIDCTTIQKHLAKIITFTDEQLALANFNKDEIVDIVDVTDLQSYLTSN